MVYQEQVMEMGRALASYTLGGADLLRRAMGKKKPAEMAKQREIFKSGCLKNGIDEATSTKIFDAMEKFANYGFNKSHAACYAWIAYQTAYLKANFFPEFMAATMTYDMGVADKLAEYADNIKRQGRKLLRPDINRSFEYFSVEGEDVRFALAGIKGVGVGAVQGIVAEREKNGDFKSVADFIGRISRSLVNKKMLEGMVKAGAFDSIEPNRAKLDKNLDYIVNEIGARTAEEESAQTNLFAVSDDFGRRDDIKLAECAPWRPMEALEAEREVIGFYVSSHPLDIFDGVIRSLKAGGTLDAKARKESGKIAIAGILESVRDKVSKAGNAYRVAHVADKMGSADVLFFDRRDGRAEIPMDAIGSAVIVNADVRVGDDGRVSLFGNSVERLSLSQALSGTLRIIVSDADAVPGVKKAIDAIPPGHCKVELVVRTDGKRASVALPGRLAVTPETLDSFKRISGVEVEF
jgi:DNA polymerase-3 subunit alpha